MMAALELSTLFSGFQQRLLLNGHRFYPCIYPAVNTLPEGCNVVSIRLDASSTSRLDWKREVEQAEFFKKAGKQLIWELDFNLYADTFSDEARFLALELAVQHFTTTIWPLFAEVSLGVILYQGSLDFSEGFPWSCEERETCDTSPSIFCRDLVLKQLKLLASCLPEEAACFLLLDTSSIEEAVTYFRLTDLGVFFPFHLILKGKWAQMYPYALPALAWGHGSSPLGVYSGPLSNRVPELNIPLALYLPEQTDWEEFGSAIQHLGSTPFRVIPEKLLVHEWEGVDRLIVCSQGVTERGRRKLYGFAAAGGEILTVGKKLGVPGEIKIPDDAEGFLLPETSLPSFLDVSPQSDR